MGNVNGLSSVTEKDLKMLKKLVKPCIGSYESEYGFSSNEVSDVINGYFYDYDNWKDYDADCPLKVTESGLYELGYTILNYDLIVVKPNGVVDVANSNHPDIAKLMKKIVPQGIWKRIYTNLFGEHSFVDSSKALIRIGRKIKDAYSQDSIITIGPILEGYQAEEIGNGDGNEGAVEYARGIDFSECEPETQTIAYRRYVDTVGDIDIFYDYGADYYFFSPNDMGAGDYVKDSCGGKSKKPSKPVGKGRGKVKDSFSDIDFFITEDNVYDLIHEGTTSVAIPSGADAKAFVAAVEDIIKDVAKDCGYKGLKLSTEIVGNMLNIFNK